MVGNKIFSWQSKGGYPTKLPYTTPGFIGPVNTKIIKGLRPLRLQLTQSGFPDNIVDKLVDQCGRFSKRISKRIGERTLLNPNNVNALITELYVGIGLQARG